MSNPQIQVYARLLQTGREMTVKLANEVPAEKRLRQLQAGKATPLWLVGHLANTMNTIVLRFMFEQESMLTKEQARLFSPDFAAGTPPSSDPEIYPAYEEVVALYDNVMGRAVELVATLSDDELPNPLKGRMPDPLRAFFSGVEVSLGFMVQHDAYHRGQIGLLSKLNA